LQHLENMLRDIIPQTEGYALLSNRFLLTFFLLNKRLSKNTLVKLMTDIFQKEEVLGNLLKAQKLDCMDVEAVVLLYRKIKALGADSLDKEWNHANIKASENDSGWLMLWVWEWRGVFRCCCCHDAHTFRKYRRNPQGVHRKTSDWKRHEEK